MGRRAKGDRHKIIASMPPRAAELVRADAQNLGCYIGDYLGWLVARGVGIDTDPPVGGVTEHPAPSPTTDGRVRYAAMVPRTAAEEVVILAEARGTTMGDLVADLVCEHFAVPFTPRILKRAIAAREKSRHLGKTLPMTG